MSLARPEIVQAGGKLYAEYGCDACHTIAHKGGFIAPDLTAPGKRLRNEFVVYYLHDPKAFVTRSVEPVFHFSASEIAALTAFLISAKEAK